MPTQVEVKAVILRCGGTEENVSRYVSAWPQIRLLDRGSLRSWRRRFAPW